MPIASATTAAAAATSAAGRRFRMRVVSRGLGGGTGGRRRRVEVCRRGGIGTACAGGDGQQFRQNRRFSWRKARFCSDSLSSSRAPHEWQYEISRPTRKGHRGGGLFGRCSRFYGGSRNREILLWNGSFLS